MTERGLAELRAKLESRAVEAEAMHATAPLADTLRWVLGQLGSLNRNGHTPDAQAPESPETLLTARQVAERLQCSPRYVYAHAGAFPFTVRLAPHSVRFSASGLDRWLALTR